MNIASIDIGTNTVLLLIVSVDPITRSFKSIVNMYEIPRLGRNLIAGGPIPPENISRFLDVMDSYRSIVNEFDCKVTLLNATNALRIASNSKEIINLISEICKFEIDIIPGEKEAYLSFLGASSSLPHLENKIVIDVGGGSTEIILGRNNQMIYRKSYQIGAVSLTETHTKHDPPQSNEIIKMRNHSKQLFSDLELDMFFNIPIIAVAGTPTTLSCMKQDLQDYDEILVEGAILTTIDLNKLIAVLSNNNSVTIRTIYGKIVEGREDVLLAGAIILDELMSMFKQNQLYVSGRGLRYGAIIDYLNNNPIS